MGLEIFSLTVGKDGKVTFHCCQDGSPEELFTDAIRVDAWSDPRSLLIKYNGWAYLPQLNCLKQL
jgi:hypothetical protein